MSEKEIHVAIIGGDVRRVRGAGWGVSETGRLQVFGRDKDVVVADFAAGQWTDVLDEAYRMPDAPKRALRDARRALRDITELRDPGGEMAPARDIAERGLAESEGGL